MFRIVVDENLWLMIEVDKLIFLDVQLINLALLALVIVVFLRAKKLYKLRTLKNPNK